MGHLPRQMERFDLDQLFDPKSHTSCRFPPSWSHPKRRVWFMGNAQEDFDPS
jgi:hypothetical protein